ncbi:hypothetical protein ACVW0K_006998 [Streptomyces filamentosus]
MRTRFSMWPSRLITGQVRSYGEKAPIGLMGTVFEVSSGDQPAPVQLLGLVGAAVRGASRVALRTVAGAVPHAQHEQHEQHEQRRRGAFRSGPSPALDGSRRPVAAGCGNALAHRGKSRTPPRRQGSPSARCPTPSTTSKPFPLPHRPWSCRPSARSGRSCSPVYGSCVAMPLLGCRRCTAGVRPTRARRASPPGWSNGRGGGLGRRRVDVRWRPCAGMSTRRGRPARLPSGTRRRRRCRKAHLIARGRWSVADVGRPGAGPELHRNRGTVECLQEPCGRAVRVTEPARHGRGRHGGGAGRRTAASRVVPRPPAVLCLHDVPAFGLGSTARTRRRHACGPSARRVHGPGDPGAR